EVGRDPLQVGGALLQLLLQIGSAAALVRRSGGRCGAFRPAGLLVLFTSGPGLFGGFPPDLAGFRVDLATITHYYPWLLTVAVVVQFGHFFSSSSTISASTTLSSPAFAEPDAPAPSPAAPAPAAPAAAWAASVLAYNAVPIACDSWDSFSMAVRMAETSLPLSASLTSLMASLTLVLTSSGSLSSFSLTNFSVWYTSDSAWLRVSASSRRLRSSSACASASLIIRSMSSFGRADPPVMVIDCSLLVPRSFAVTCTMPLASMSNVTSICGTPRGAGGMPVSSNMPSFLLCAAISRSPWNTWICTDGWLSSAVEKISERLVGIVVLRSMSLVNTPPVVSMPSDSGVTSSSRTSFTSPLSTPACSAAPTATTSSGFTPLFGSLPPVSSLTRSATAGIRVEPPTSTTWSMSPTEMPASRSTLLNGWRVRSSRSAVIFWNSARDSVSSRNSGFLSASTVM